MAYLSKFYSLGLFFRILSPPSESENLKKFCWLPTSLQPSAYSSGGPSPIAPYNTGTKKGPLKAASPQLLARRFG